MKILEVTPQDIELNELEKTGENLDDIWLSVDQNHDYIHLEEEDHAGERGFVGKAVVYDEEIYINTYTGEGYDAVISKMKNYINRYSNKVRLSGFERDDIKQLIIVILLDGIRRYNPKLKIRLSTFLYVHIKNRIISRIKEETRQSLNATYNEPFYKFICPCGTNFVSNKEDAVDAVCASCKIKVDVTWKIRSEHHTPVSLDTIMTVNDDESSNDRSSRIHYNGRKNNLIDFFGRIDTIEDIDKDLDFINILNDEDEVTRKIAELMYHEDYSITDAAREVGLTCWAASLRLKKLKSKKHVKEFFLNK